MPLQGSALDIRQRRFGAAGRFLPKLGGALKASLSFLVGVTSSTGRPATQRTTLQLLNASCLLALLALLARYLSCVLPAQDPTR